jgi:SAM-dependent methyltransferase
MNTLSGRETLVPAEPEPSGPGCLRLRCPRCLRGLQVIDVLDLSASVQCFSCGLGISSQNGIWRAVAPGRKEHFRQFVCEYQRIRALEGRGSRNPEFYLKLPYEDLTGRNRWQWKIRGRSFSFFETRILPAMGDGYRRDLDILDLGAGNCWMSYRLALRGHRPLAVDLLDNFFDGLGAARHYLARLPRSLPRFQAEMDRLPFADRQFDVAIFNASFHYSEDYHATIREALRCLRRPGYLVIMDSPLYWSDASGEQMVRERRAAFTRRFGLTSDSIPSLEYLTAGILQELARMFQLAWQIEKPWYGLRWALRPVKARLLGRREPSKFFLIWTKVGDA